MRTHRDTVTAEKLRRFLAARDRFAANIPDTPADGQARAVAAIEEYARELTCPHRFSTVQVSPSHTGQWASW